MSFSFPHVLGHGAICPFPCILQADTGAQFSSAVHQVCASHVQQLWQMPTDAVLCVKPAPQAAAAAPAAAAPSVPKLAPPSKPGAAGGLPPGWGQATDLSSGRIYYFHSVTGVQRFLAHSARPCLSDTFCLIRDSAFAGTTDYLRRQDEELCRRWASALVLQMLEHAMNALL